MSGGRAGIDRRHIISIHLTFGDLATARERPWLGASQKGCEMGMVVQLASSLYSRNCDGNSEWVQYFTDGYTVVILYSMKTAISIPDDLFSAAEATARRMGIARSQLFAKAVEEFISNHDRGEITSQINEVLENQNVSLDPNLTAMQVATLLQDSENESW